MATVEHVESAEAANMAEATVAAANRQSAMMKDRLEEQYAWRKEQLEREVNALQLRKDALVAQLANIRELGEEAEEDFGAAADTAEPAADVRLPPAEGADESAEDTHEIPVTDGQEWLKEAPAGQGQAGADEPTALINTERLKGAGAQQTDR